MIRIFSILILIHLFNSQLENVTIYNHKKAIFIILNTLYCQNCLSALKEIKLLNPNEYKTILIMASKKNLRSTYINNVYYKSLVEFDEIYFFEDSLQFSASDISLKDINFIQTPVLLIKNDSSLIFLNYYFLYGSGINSENINYKLKEILSKK